MAKTAYTPTWQQPSHPDTIIVRSSAILTNGASHAEPSTSSITKTDPAANTSDKNDSANTNNTTAAAADGDDDPESSFSLAAVASRDLPAHTLVACNTSTTLAPTQDYSTVQISEMEHGWLNSDLLYCNHSCEPNVRFVTATLGRPEKKEEEKKKNGVLNGEGAGATTANGTTNGTPIPGAIEVWTLRPIAAGEELSFFYPSTEADMAAPFHCRCGAPGCLGIIDGARRMDNRVLRSDRYWPWLSEHVRRAVEEEEGKGQ